MILLTKTNPTNHLSTPTAITPMLQNYSTLFQDPGITCTASDTHRVHLLPKPTSSECSHIYTLILKKKRN